MKIDTASLARQQLHDLIGNIISPLPIAFISTVGPDGTHNASPFSFVAPVCTKPPIICVSFALKRGQKKDTVRNIESTGDFVINVVDEAIIQQAIQASGDYPSGVDELKETGLTAIKSDRVKSPRVAEAKINLECRMVQKLEIMEEGAGLRAIVFGEVLVMHIKDEVWVNGEIDPFRLKPVGRVGRNLYCRTGDIIEVKRTEIKA
ncbi:MAG: flavin reductase family protein [Chloroflexi bacterium]|nr:flavin reductase family protein [Chloroflexota bacterium]